MGGQRTNRRIDGARLWDSLIDLARLGATAKGGVRRLALSEADRQARDQFRAWCEAAGLAVRVDAIGNMFARREGRDPARKPVLFGSHLDTQPNGGRFDGALGVLAGLEVMRALNEHGIDTEAPLELVNWTDEEGCRFGFSLAGSGVWAGVVPAERVRAQADRDGISFGAALDGIGYAGTAPARAFPADAYFELHIEQGPILQEAGARIGIVTGAQAQVWYDAVATGQDSHAGTTPPSARRDALVAAARVITLVDRIMRDHGEHGRGTVGQLTVSPNSRNVIAGEVRFSVEFRHPDTAALERIAAAFPPAALAAVAECGVALELTELFRLPALAFDPACVALVAAAAGEYPARRIVSGAGHDALYVARQVPAAMIFVPCKDGLSHNEAESITPEDAAAGCQVLFAAVLARAM